MLRRGYFSGTSPEGYGVAERYYAAGGRRATGVGTNMMEQTGLRAWPSLPSVQGFEQSWSIDERQRAVFVRSDAAVFGYGLAADPLLGKAYAVQAIGVVPASPGTAEATHLP
jgi:hypothetical protein